LRPGDWDVELRRTYTIASGFMHWGLSGCEPLPAGYVRVYPLHSGSFLSILQTITERVGQGQQRVRQNHWTPPKRLHPNLLA
jgi:hypothetical protein